MYNELLAAAREAFPEQAPRAQRGEEQEQVWQHGAAGGQRGQEEEQGSAAAEDGDGTACCYFALDVETPHLKINYHLDL